MFKLKQDNETVQFAIDKILAIGEVTVDEAGLMSPADKRKLDAMGIFYDTSAHWAEIVGFIPAAGNIVIYSDHRTFNDKVIPGVKVGTGNAYVQDLPFIDDDIVADLYEHIQDNVRHITAAERAKWNAKLSVDDAQEVVDETLIFGRD